MILYLQEHWRQLQDPIQPTTAKLNTADGSPVTALGITALHLSIVEFKFKHNFVICDRLPDLEIIFSIDIQKKFSLSYAWDKEKIVIYKEMANSRLTHETANERQQLAQLNHHLRYHCNTMVLYQLKFQDQSLRNILLTSLQMKIHQRVMTQTSTLLMAFKSSKGKHLSTS